jgi:cell division protein WhiA
MTTGSFTEAIRQELAGSPVEEATARQELGLVLRLGGRLHRVGTSTGSHTTIEVASTSGAVVRRTYRLLPAATETRPRLWVRAPSGVETSTTYGLVVTEDVHALLAELGLVDDSARPIAGLPPASDPATVVRACLLTISSCSAPGRPVHLELRSPSRAVSAGLSAALRDLDVASHHDTDRERLVVKSGAAVSALLRHAGAVRAADEFDDRRDRRELRNRATRLSNADAANVRRSVEAAQDQLQDIERAVARVGWAGLGEDLRALALTRLVNPEASLAELAALCDPPASKSAVHRRMARISAIARGQA